MPGEKRETQPRACLEGAEPRWTLALVRDTMKGKRLKKEGKVNCGSR